MLKLVRSRLSYANVVSSLALFIALAGTSAYAANTIFSEDIADGQVKTLDLEAGAVKNGRLGDSAVSSGKVLDNHLTGDDVRDDTLKGADIDESSLTVGSLRGPSNGYFATNGVPNSGDPATFTIPPGQYIIAASFGVFGAAGATLTCQVRLGDGRSSSSSEIGPSGSIAVVFSVPITTTTVVTGSCPDPDVSGYNAGLSAIRVASLN